MPTRRRNYLASNWSDVQPMLCPSIDVCFWMITAELGQTYSLYGSSSRVYCSMTDCTTTITYTRRDRLFQIDHVVNKGNSSQIPNQRLWIGFQINLHASALPCLKWRTAHVANSFSKRGVIVDGSNQLSRSIAIRVAHIKFELQNGTLTRDPYGIRINYPTPPFAFYKNRFFFGIRRAWRDITARSGIETVA